LGTSALSLIKSGEGIGGVRVLPCKGGEWREEGGGLFEDLPPSLPLPLLFEEGPTNRGRLISVPLTLFPF